MARRASRQRALPRYETTVDITAAVLFDALEARILNFEMRCFIYSSANLVLGLFPPPCGVKRRSSVSAGRLKVCVQLSVDSASLLSLQELNHRKPAPASLPVDVR